MLAYVKKIHRHSDELLHLALILSLIRMDPDSFLGLNRAPILRGNVTMGDMWAHRGFHDVPYLHPKSMEASLTQYQEDLIEDLNDLGRYSGILPAPGTITAYLLNESSTVVLPTGSLTTNEQPEEQQSTSQELENTSGLSLEDADLIEILWKQDIDIGVPRDHFLFPVGEKEEETLKLDEKEEKKDAKHGDKDDDLPKDDDPWAGLPYRIDDETGEYILLERTEGCSSDSGCEADCQEAPEAEQGQLRRQESPLSLDKALGFVDFDSDEFGEEKLTASNFTLGEQSPESDELIGGLDPVLGSIAAPTQPNLTERAAEAALGSLLLPEEDSSSPSQALIDGDFDLGFYFGAEEEPEEDKASTSADSLDLLSEQLEASLEDMIQTAQMHPRSLQVRMPLMRTMSMEHRWQDLANFLSLPDGAAAAAAAANMSSHHHHHNHAVHHHHPHMHMGHHHPHFAHPGYPHSTVHHHHNPHHGYGHHGYTAATPVSAYQNAADGRAALLHNAAATPLTELGANGTYPSPSIGVGVTLGSAVTASMNLTNSTDSLEPSAQVPYKAEGTSDMHLYYQQNNTSEVNQTGDGFFPSIFNEDDLQLMDMAITDTMYTPRLLDNQTVNHGIGMAAASSVGAAGPSVIPSTVIDTTSDSAVSSMGSERGPSISDGDWIDSNATDSNATSVAGATAVLPSGSAYGMEYSSGAKYRHYDYGYNRSNSLESGRGGASGATPVAQKKHQMFGKRVFHEQGDLPGSPVAVAGSPAKFDYNSGATASGGSLYSHPATPLDSGMSSMEMKYGCGMDYTPHPHDVRGMDHVHHNHTYAMGSEASGVLQRPVSRDKHRASGSSLRGSVSDTSSTAGAGTSGSCSESEAYSRDEKRARSMNIPMTVDDIINLPMDEFNERLSKYDLTEPQLSLIRDIRRRGKNKVAAQNCRKRKLDQILTLADEVKRARERKIRLHKERDFLVTEKSRIKDRFAQLYRHVFQSLRDGDGQPYSPYEYSLQQSADGNILLVPRANAGGATIDPHPQHQQFQRSLMDPSNSSLPMHGARRKTPDHKNEP